MLISNIRITTSLVSPVQVGESNKVEEDLGSEKIAGPETAMEEARKVVVLAGGWEN